MKSKILSAFAVAALVATPVLAAGKKAGHPKTEKACTEKGGTWDAKKKKCAEAAKPAEAAPAAPAPEAAPPAETTPPPAQ